MVSPPAASKPRTPRASDVVYRISDRLETLEISSRILIRVIVEDTLQAIIGEGKIGEVARGVITWILVRGGWRCPFS